MTLPRPVSAVVKPGVLSADDELQALARASFERRLTPAEEGRIRALSFTPDADLETARLIRTRHPDLYGELLGQLRERLEGINTPSHRVEGYEPRRQSAIDAGRVVPEPDARAIATADSMAAEFRATAVDRYADCDERHRAAFAALVRTDGLGAAAVAEWAAWLAERVEANAFAGRRARALAYFGRSTFADVRPAPTLIAELEDALGGGTVRAMMPVPQR